MDIMGTRAPSPVADTTILPAASIPAGSIAVFVGEGVAKSHDAVNGIWVIGPIEGRDYTVYESYHTVLRSPNVQLDPQVGDVVRFVTVRTIAPGPLTGVAVTLRPDDPLSPVFVPSIGIAYFYPGIVQSIVTATDTIWTVGGVPFNTTDNVFPADIEPFLGVGNYVVMEYLIPLAAQGQAATITAMEIFARVPPPNMVPIAANPTIDNTPIPAGLPAGTRVGFIVDGVVSAFDPLRGEWLIGSNNYPVYESADTASRRFGGMPGVGDGVKMLAFRTVAPGPVVADVTVFRTRGPVPNVTPALVETLFLYDGTVEAISPNSWTVGGVTFSINNPNFPPAIDPLLGLGSTVTVEFQIVGGAPPADPNGWIPMTLDPVTGRWRAVYNAPAVPQNWDGFVLVRATDGLGRTTISEDAATLLPASATTPAAPTALAGVPGISGINLTWTDNSIDEASFRIQRSNDTAFTTGLTQFFAANNVTAFTDYTIVPGVNYYYRVFAVNGAGSSTPSNILQIIPVTFTITASAGANGTITPSGAVVVASGASQAFTIAPNAGFVVADVLVDGVSAGVATAYTFTAVAADHTISATFAAAPPVTFTINASAGANGTITPSGAVVVASGASQAFTMTPAVGFAIASVIIDGIPTGTGPTATFDNVIANHTISVSFVAAAPPSSFTITASAGIGGTISPAGAVTVARLGEARFSITPAAGKVIADVMVDGVSVGAVSNYRFRGVVSNHTISASFSALPGTGSFTVNASAGANGTISPSGAVTVANRASQSFTIIPAAGYRIASVVIDGTSVGAVAVHTFRDVRINHTISASFASIPPPGVPSAPASLNAKAASPTQVEVRWTDTSNNENGFRIEKSVDGFQTIAESFVVPANTTRIRESNVVLGNILSYRVVAYNFTGDSAPSNVVEVLFDSAKTPEVPTATVNHGVVTLSWVDNSNDETEFVIERAEDPAFLVKFTSFVIPGSPVRLSTVTFSDNSVSSRKTYLYRLRARNAIDDSNPTAAVTVTVTAPSAAPVAPSLLSPANSARPGDLTPTLLWTPGVAGVTFEVQVSDSKVFSSLLLNAAGVTGSSITVPASTLSASRTYWWRVRAVNEAGASAWSQIFSFRTPEGPRTLRVLGPRGTTATLTPTLEWSAIAGATYDVQVSRERSFSVIAAEGTVVLTNSFNVPGGALQGSTLYFWRVRATTGDGVSRWATGVFRTPFGPRVLPVPLSPRGSINTLTPSLQWKILRNEATSFDIQISTSPRFVTVVLDVNGVLAPPFTPGGTATFDVPAGTLLPGTRYFWRVRGVNVFGESRWQMGVFVTRPGL